MHSLPSTSPFLLLSGALQGLLGRVGGWHLRGFVGDLLVLVLHRRISMCRVRLERLIGRYLAGTLRARSGRMAVTPAGTAGAATRVTATRIWPVRFGWLLRCLQPAWLPIERSASWEAGQHGAPLRFALESAEMQAFLVAVPQAARVLGPVCRMLAIERTIYQPGFVAKVRAVRDASIKRVRVAKATIDWGRIPLPRGVMTAAKRDRALEKARAEVVRLRKASHGF